MNTTLLNLEAGGAVSVVHPDTGKRSFLLRINADVPLDGLMRDDEDGEQAPTGVDVPGSHD